MFHVECPSLIPKQHLTASNHQRTSFHGHGPHLMMGRWNGCGAREEEMGNTVNKVGGNRPSVWLWEMDKSLRHFIGVYSNHLKKISKTCANLFNRRKKERRRDLKKEKGYWLFLEMVCRCATGFWVWYGPLLLPYTHLASTTDTASVQRILFSYVIFMDQMMGCYPSDGCWRCCWLLSITNMPKHTIWF